MLKYTILATVLLASPAFADCCYGEFNVINQFYPFGGQTEGTPLPGDLVAGSDGNVYNTLGFNVQAGTQGAFGQWLVGSNTYNVNYFASTLSTGAFPQGDFVVNLGVSGSSIYMPTMVGGSSNNCTNGCGVISKWFKPSYGGTTPPPFIQTVLHSFSGPGNDGDNPTALVYSSGVLYGIASDGPTLNNGNIFSINASTGVFNTLYEFTASPDAYPQSLNIDTSTGLLYGTTLNNNSNGAIFVFNGSTYTSLHEFSAAECVNPTPHIYVDSINHVLYGTCTKGGLYNKGDFWSYNVTTNTLSILYSFIGPVDGKYPMTGVIYDPSDGSFYGTAYQGGSNFCSNRTGCGTIWSYNVAKSTFITNYYFFGSGTDGAFPNQTPTAAYSKLYGKYIIYGTTSSAGDNNAGTEWSLLPTD